MRYPNGIKKDYIKKESHSNRGMSLENELNITNQYYLTNNIAVIYKKPTPITIKKVEYQNNNKKVIKEAWFKTPSTTDYNGIYNNLYIDFEAKETKKLSFPLANIHKHQIEHLERIAKCGGIGFIIVKFTCTNETYFLSIENFLDYFKHQTKKSIPLKYFQTNGYLIKQEYNPPLDYLKIIDKIRSEKYEKIT